MMHLYKLYIFVGLMNVFKGELVDIKRDIKYIGMTYLADLPETEIDAVLSRSFLECIKICHMMANCLSTLYKEEACWLVKGTISFSTTSCFQMKNETTKAYVGLAVVSIVSHLLEEGLLEYVHEQ